MNRTPTPAPAGSPSNALQSWNPQEDPTGRPRRRGRCDSGDSVEARFRGSRGALLADGFALPEQFNGIVTVRGPDGLDWQIDDSGGSFCLVASRARTPAEREAWIDASNATVPAFAFFSIDRQQLCAELTSELLWLTCQLQPERPMSRRLRRRTKSRLSEISELLRQLLWWTEVDMPSVRRRIAALGLDCVQTDFRAMAARGVH